MKNSENKEDAGNSEPKKAYKKPVVKKYDRIYEPGLGS